MRVIKFGGSSTADIGAINKVVDIIKKHKMPLIVVFSAMGKTTENILQLINEAKGSINLSNFNKFTKKWYKLVEDLELDPKLINNEISSFNRQIFGIASLKELYPKTLAFTLALGEIISAKILHAHIAKQLIDYKVEYLDSRSVILTDSNHTDAIVKDITFDMIKQKIEELKFDVLIMPGFIGNDSSGHTTTLGRGGGDYTASIVGCAVDAELVEICSDVDGVLTCNPHISRDAKLIRSLSYEHAYEISYYGGKILYHKTLKPVYQKKIPVLIKNTFNYDHSGTIINNKVDGNYNSTRVKAITNLDSLTLCKFRGLEMKGSIGVSCRLFTAVHKAGTNIHFISQSSAETCIYFCIDTNKSKETIQEINREFEQETKNKSILLETFDSKSIIAIVVNKNESAFITKKFFDHFHDIIEYDIISQSDININIVVNSNKVLKYVTLLHDYFVLKNVQQ